MTAKEHEGTPSSGHGEHPAEDVPIRALRDHLDSLLDDIEQGIIVYGTDGRIAFANVAAARIFGFATVAELTGASDDDRTSRVAIFDQFGFPLPLTELPGRRVLREAQPIATTLRTCPVASAADGWFSVRARLLTQEPALAPLVLSVWDNITERQQAEAKNRHLAAIVATSDDAIVSKTLDGTVTSWNRAAERLFGWTAEEMVGSSIARIVPAEKRTELAEILARLGRGEVIDHHETVRIARDGRRIDVSVSISPLVDDTGRVVGAAKIGRDITARRDAERFADSFLADLAHDLNNPLATARVQTQLLKRRLAKGTLNPDATLQALGQIEAGIKRASRRVGELSDLARLRLEKAITLEPRPIDLVALVHELVDGHAQSERIVIETDADQLIGMWDPERIDRVFDNLLSNALKYSSEPVALTICVAPSTDGTIPERAVVTVVDRGVGILPTDLPHVFDRFRRGRNVIGRFAGTGIGLAGVRQIVEQHGGTITLSSAPNQGTVVIVSLPLKTDGNA